MAARDAHKTNEPQGRNTMRHLTIADAFQQWGDVFRPVIPAGDGPAHAESWNDFTDSLCKDGSFNDLQYHHCPAWDDEMPDDDAEFLLERMGVSLRLTGTASALIRRGAKETTFQFAAGAVPQGAPSDADLFAAIVEAIADSEDESEAAAPLACILSASELADLTEIFFYR
jgi:hypothetical protein